MKKKINVNELNVSLKYNGDDEIYVTFPKGFIKKDKGKYMEGWVWQGFIHENKIELIKLK